MRTKTCDICLEDAGESGVGWRTAVGWSATGRTTGDTYIHKLAFCYLNIENHWISERHVILECDGSLIDINRGPVIPDVRFGRGL